MAPKKQTQMTKNSPKKQTQMTKTPPVVTSSSDESRSTDDNHMETDAVRESKKSSEAEEKKPKRFVRMFSEEDELAVLEGIIKLKSKSTESKVFPLDMGALFLCIEGLSFNASIAQLESKIKRLKNRFDNAINKPCGKGKRQAVSKKFNSKFFQLSKEIWGGELCKPLENLKGESSNGGRSEISSFLYAQKLMSLDEPKFHACWDIIPDGPKKREMERRFKTMKATEVDLCLLRTQITADATKVVFGNRR